MDAPPEFSAYLESESASDTAPSEQAPSSHPPRENRGLGNLPIGDESTDISAMLADVPLSAPPAAAAPFVFGETSLPDVGAELPIERKLTAESEATLSPLGRVALERREVSVSSLGDEATMIGDAGYFRDVLEQIRTPAPAAGWRVKNDRGVIYELRNLDAVVAWLQGKPDVSKVMVAQGENAFKNVLDNEALVVRLGLSDPNLERLELDMSRASERHGGDLGSMRAASSTMTPSPTGPLDARRQTEASFGLGVVLVAIAVACLLAVGGTQIALEGGYVELPDSPLAVVPASEGEPSPALARAINEFEAKNYTTATNLLSRLSQTEDDPRVHRYLALVLHATKRDTEALNALSRYRRALRRGDGDHAGQVRPVRN